MNALLLLLGCLSLGYAIARFADAPAGLARGINWWSLRIALPALVLELVPNLVFDPDLWFPILALWVVFVGAWIVAHFAGRALGWSRARIGAVVLMCGLGNTAFAGYPLIEALRGKESLGIAMIADQLGCFTALSIGGIAAAAYYSGGRAHPLVVMRRIAVFPPFIAFFVGLLAAQFGGWPDSLNSVLARVGATLTPLAMFSIGLQFHLQLDRAQLGAASVALGWKLFFAPLLVFALGISANVGHEILAVSVLQSAMGPMISAAILVDEHGLDTHVANATLGAGLLLSLVTVPLASALLG